MPTDRTRLPLPDEFLMHPTQGECYTLNQLRAYSDAECAPLMEEIEALRQDGSKLTAENAALLAESRDCRTCKHLFELPHGAVYCSIFGCTNADRYDPLPVVRLWRTKT